MNKLNESTHIVFDGKNIQISPNIRKIFDFLIDMERESDIIFEFEKRLEEVREYYSELLGLTESLSKALQDSNVEGWSYNLKKDPRNFADVLKYHIPIRTQMIHLFTQLEVMYFLYIAYSKEVDGENDLRNIAMKDPEFRKGFIKKFLLSEDNDYYKLHKNRFKKLDSGKIIRLRNSLVHFFSLPKDSIGIYANQDRDRVMQLEKRAIAKKNGSLIMLSSIDLRELVRGAFGILIKEWTKDTYSDNENFKRKISFVKNVVDKHGVVLVYFNDSDFK